MNLAYRHVCLEALAFTLPDEIVSSAEIETRLAPLYDRLKLPSGRLELMTGVRERRLWSPGTLPGSVSVRSGQALLNVAQCDPTKIGALIHGSVCRDHLEPATATRVHHELGLPEECLVYDVSNACLGLGNGMLQVANMIELGQIEAGLVVGSEGSRQLLETTIAQLNRDTNLSRNDMKLAVASLTIGSASAAMLLVHERISRTGNRLVAAAARARTAFHDLCHSGADEAAAGGMQPLMTTDSTRLMEEGIATGVATFNAFLAATSWTRSEIDRTVCHQVGAAHRKLMLGSLELPEERDFATFDWLGNTGSAALPVSLALAAREGFVQPGQKLALLGIGSGINCLMLGVAWQKALVAEGQSP
jgi:3-oxoacyl-[acyl-carrier-protein] synthase-3